MGGREGREVGSEGEGGREWIGEERGKEKERTGKKEVKARSRVHKSE